MGNLASSNLVSVIFWWWFLSAQHCTYNARCVVSVVHLSPRLSTHLNLSQSRAYLVPTAENHRCIHCGCFSAAVAIPHQTSIIASAKACPKAHHRRPDRPCQKLTCQFICIK